jgi:hypothetical protein
MRRSSITTSALLLVLLRWSNKAGAYNVRGRDIKIFFVKSEGMMSLGRLALIKLRQVLGTPNRLLSFDTTQTARKAPSPKIFLLLRVNSLLRELVY